MTNPPKKSGYIALIGKPNVGKSTLMNDFLGKKVSITSRKPQTTRHRILGIKTTDAAQMIFVDTPGLHQDHQHAMNRMMNRAARSALSNVDVVLFVVEALHWDAQDAAVIRELKSITLPIILVINKIDQIKDKAQLLPFIENISKEYDFKNIVPIAAKTGLQVDQLEKTIEPYLPHEGNLFPPAQFTDRSDRFMVTEFVREKLMRFLGEEVPYQCAVTIELFEEAEPIIRVSVLIWVATEGQKAIVIGKQGDMLKQIGTAARHDLEFYFKKKVFLKLWVKVKSNWADDAKALHDFGYDEN